MSMSKNVRLGAFTVFIGIVVGALIYNSGVMKQRRFINALVERNIEARGGAQAWEKVSSMKVEGQMELGQGLSVPYTLMQKRPDKMCFAFEFNRQTSTQCVNGDEGWKIAPFRGRDIAEKMTDAELREMADSTDPFGLLYNYRSRGIDIEMVGKVKLNHLDAIKLKLTLDKGAVRWLYIDPVTALVAKMEMTRMIAHRSHRVETVYSDWKKTDDGLLIAHRQETRTEGDPKAHYLTVHHVSVNPPIADARFMAPTIMKDKPQLAIRQTPYEH